MAEIELHRRLEAPFQRHLVDPPRRLAARHQRVVHGAEEVVWRIQMGAVMAADLDPLDRGVFAVRQIGDPHAHVVGDRRRGLVMVDIVDLRQHMRRVAGDAGAQRAGDVDQAAGHGAFPLLARHHSTSAPQPAKRHRRSRTIPA
jgi:hypothetical protein